MDPSRVQAIDERRKKKNRHKEEENFPIILRTRLLQT